MKTQVPHQKLGDLFHFQNGRSFQKQEWASAGLPIIRIQNLNDLSAPFNHYAGNYNDEILIRSGDLLFSWSGTVGSSFGPHIWDRPNGLLNQHIFKVGFKQNIAPRFAYYALEFITEAIEKSVNGAVGLVHVTKEKLNKFTIPLPDINEQHRIAAILDEAFSGIAIAKTNTEKNRQNATALLSQGYLDIAEKQGRGHWERRRVADVAATRKGSIRTGPFGSQLLHGEFVDAGIAVLGIDNAVANEFRWGKRRYITPEKFEQLARYRVYPGDVLITIMGTCGRCAVVPDDIPVAINTKHLCCISLDQDRCIPSYLHIYFLNDPLAKEYLQQQAKGTVMDGLNMSLIVDMPLLLPSIDEQRAVVSNFRTLQEGIGHFSEIQRNKFDALNALKQSLLVEAFAGKL